MAAKMPVSECGRTRADYAASEANDTCRECGNKVSEHSGEYSGGDYGVNPGHWYTR